jgi:hypothetical protein
MNVTIVTIAGENPIIFLIVVEIVTNAKVLIMIIGIVIVVTSAVEEAISLEVVEVCDNSL